MTINTIIPSLDILFLIKCIVNDIEVERREIVLSSRSYNYVDVQNKIGKINKAVNQNFSVLHK